MSGEFQFLIELVERGTADERRTALQVIGGILQATSQGVGTLPPELAAWIGAALVSIANGADPGEALSLKVTKNRTTSFAQTKAAQAAMQTVQDAGMTWEEARAKVADQLGISDDNLSRRITRLTGQT